MYRITPKAGLVIRDPERRGQILPVEGITVNRLNPFWLRRLEEQSIDVLSIPDAPRNPVLRRDPEV